MMIFKSLDEDDNSEKVFNFRIAKVFDITDLSFTWFDRSI